MPIMNDKKTMGKYEAPYKVAKTEKKEVDLNPQRKKTVNCDYIDPADFPILDNDQL